MFRNCKENVIYIRLQSRKHNLGLGVAEPAVEFNDLDAVRGLHQAAVEDSPERYAFLRHSGSDRLHNMLNGIFPVFVSHERQAGIGSHSASVRALVAVVCALVVLGQDHRHYFPAAYKAEKGKFRPGEEFLHYHLAVSEPVIHKHIPECLVRLLEIFCNDNALTCGKSVIFENDREFPRPYVCQCLIVIGECLISGSRDIVTIHQSLGEILA